MCGLGDMVKGTRTEVQNDTGRDRETETGTVGLGQGNRDRDIVCGLGTRLQRDMQEKGSLVPMQAPPSFPSLAVRQATESWAGAWERG